jgi:hypothetical protein
MRHEQARWSNSCTGTPSKLLSSRLHVVTQCMSHVTVLRGRASNSSYVMENGWCTRPDTMNVHWVVSTRGTLP